MAKAKNTNPRVHEISKNINISSKDLIALLAKYGFEAKNHMTVLEYKHIDIILTTYLNQYDKGDTIEEYYASLKAEKAES
ncbi:MAG: translation initiation factor IF-2 N-terminal domain-containing protein, partial [Clostridia bacterium]|nr:translation initiation factor IF-2 N-terminal domain-containing protein [Clostridia bacterium]